MKTFSIPNYDYRNTEIHFKYIIVVFVVRSLNYAHLNKNCIYENLIKKKK